MTIGYASTVFDTSLFIPELRYRTLEPVLGEMTARAVRSGAAREPRHLRCVLSLREKAGSTNLGRGAALPHARSIAVIEPCLVVGRCAEGILWDEADEEKVQLVVMGLSPSSTALDVHLEWIGRIASVIRNQRPRQKLLAARDFDDVAEVLREVCA
jgi:mannitol/fructose-specific phosphotransferase system IIA component (Ntr-type)